eukprot:CAMPEP_0115152384 /NCGR_PEP_ID=MMETSP0227-20121206/66132_1 /TAXON_ID=89957 /ORGANISM="Polarella glacialis, Strain CCMP 1383" /LENGTH=259 /DNA_ID=CAMNT_0002562989 /DNA_START=51 /DNA_END=830 /DNA_ORIENTATION=-
MAFVSKKDSTLNTVVKGFATGGTMVVLSYPLEYVKTQMQLQSKTAPQYTGMADCAKQTISKHGFAGLYKGASVRVVGAGCQQMCRWGAYTKISSFFREDSGKISVIGNTLSGMGAGVCEAIIAVTPVETIKTRVNDDMRRGTNQYKGSGDAIVKIIKSEGPIGLYRGCLPTILKQGTNQAVRMPLQAQFFAMIVMGDESKKKSPIYNGIAGALAGVLQNEGPQAFFAGSAPRSIQMAANVGLTFAIYPAISNLLEKFGI